MQSFSRAQWITSAAFATLSNLGPSLPVRAQGNQVITIGAGSIEAHAEAYYAADQGLFRKNGLNADVQTMRSGAAIAAAVAGGDLQVGISSVLQLAEARCRDLPFVIITPGAVHDGKLAHTTNLVVAPNSGIANAKDLNGKVVAVNTLNGLDQLIVEALIDQSGGNSSTVQFVEVVPSAAAEAVLRGRVAAAQLEEPELSAARPRVRLLGDGEDALATRFVTTGWFTTASWLAENKDAARRFSAAIFGAGAWAMQHREQAGAVLRKVLGLRAPRALQNYATRRDPKELEPLIAASAKYKLTCTLAGSELVWDGR